MEILANWGLMPTWCNGCTNANYILTESWGSAEVKKCVCFFFLGANNAQTSTDFHLISPNHRGIAPTMEILANSGWTPTWCNKCTNANCILTASWGYAEVKNVVFSSVQTTHRLIRATKLTFPIHRGTAPQMEILANLGLKPAFCNECTNENCMFTESWGYAEVKNVDFPDSKQRTILFGLPNASFLFTAV